jgi:hypothetical protein
MLGEPLGGTSRFPNMISHPWTSARLSAVSVTLLSHTKMSASTTVHIARRATRSLGIPAL